MITSGFVRKKVEALTLGERLKKMRADRCMTTTDVSRATGVQARYVEALESGDYSRLPADVYVRGFLKSYASYFGASPEPFVLLYDRERGIEQTLRAQSKDFPKDQKIPFPHLTITPKMLTTAIAISICLVSVGYIYIKFNDFVSKPSLIITDPVSGTSVSKSLIVIRGVSDRNGSVFINGEPVIVDENGNFSESVALHPGTNDIVVSASNRFEKETIKKISVESVLKPDVTENDLQHRIVIRSERESVSIKVKNEHGEIWSGVLVPGNPQEVFLTGIPMISTENGQAVYITMDEKEEEHLSDVSGPVQDKVIQ